MRAEDWPRFTELIDEALELRAEERADWMQRLTGPSAALRPELVEWLNAEQDARGFLETPLAPGASWARGSWLPLEPGAVIGRYRLLRVIGFGGSSVVYEAEQDDPRRSVALKVFQAGVASARARERFKEEGRILANLPHPGIAQVFEAGTERAGPERVKTEERPWIAMELVDDARPITEHAQDLGLAARLELFARVCDAVAYGHQHGIVHRDLKPANLLVDAAGDPKVIDFGVAKVLGSASLEVTRLTGGLLGTLAWMSPEQLAGDSSLVDTRVDVYALGVVLYELVCGQLPHALDELSLKDALHVVSSVAPRRPAELARAVDRDLEAVMLTALAKDPDARYRTAGELAADLRRNLAREPVVARRPSVSHHLRLSIGRHRGIALASAVGAVLLLSALIFGVAEANRVEAKERAKANDVTMFLKSVLALASPSTAARPNLTMREVLADAAPRIDTELADAPDALAEVHALVGSAWRELEELERAEFHLSRAVAVFRETRPGSAELAGALSMLSELLLDAQRGREAEVVLLEARQLYADQSDLPEFYIGIVTNKLAEANRLQGKLEAGEQLARRALTIYRRSFGERHVATASALSNLAAIQLDSGARTAAEESAREALAIFVEVTGEESQFSTRTRQLLAEIQSG